MVRKSSSHENSSRKGLAKARSAQGACNDDTLMTQCDVGCKAAQSCCNKVVAYFGKQCRDGKITPDQAVQKVSDGCKACNKQFCRKALQRHK